MPKRGGRSRHWREDNDYYEHDDRPCNSKRRVSFKPGTHKGTNKFRIWNADPTKLLDDDIDMGASANMGPRLNVRRIRGGRLNSPAPKMSHAGPKRKFIPGPLPWYEITIPYGAKHEKDVLLRALLSYMSPDIFIPHYYKNVGNAAVFYVDDVKMAEMLFNADRKIVMPDGFKLLVIVKNVIPKFNINDEMKDKMKLTMAKRYNPATKALDLTKFHADPDLSEIFCALFRPQIMLAAVDIIAENIPDLEALNLNDNKLHGLAHLKQLSTKLKCLKILYIGDNKIPFLSALEPLQSLPLVELYLKGNPLVSRFKDHEVYVREIFQSMYLPLAVFLSSDVRRKFPKLVRLDGEELPPLIGFDVTDTVTFPPYRQSFLIDPQGQDLVRDFLTQYYAIYDSESRHPLLEAYHEHGMMSMAANYLTMDNRSLPSLRLNAYISNSRNLLRITDREPRRRYLRTGKLHIVSFLSDLPKTKHDLMGFAVDLQVFTPTMIILTVGGVFVETATPENPKRSFHRTLVIVPNAGGGYCIMNDLLYITNTTKEQESRTFTSGVPAQVPTPQPPQAPVAVPSTSSATPDEVQKAQLIATISQTTGMNAHWSLNCLQETGWDLQRALFIFNQLQSEGKIPPAAFVK